MEEGSAENPARITLSLSAESYHFDVIINIDPPLPDPIPTPTNILFEQGVTQAVSVKNNVHNI